MFKYIRDDFATIREKDPAARGWLEIIICYPGFQAISLHRVSHKLWKSRLPLKLIARCLSQIGRAATEHRNPSRRKNRQKCVYRSWNGGSNW